MNDEEKIKLIAEQVERFTWNKCPRCGGELNSHSWAGNDCCHKCKICADAYYYLCMIRWIIEENKEALKRLAK